MDYKSLYLARLKRLKEIESNERLKQIEFELCKRSIIHWLENWVFTYDPRRDPKHFPFIPYQFQKELFAWIDERYQTKSNGLIEKSRDMGITWCVSAWAVHKWIFANGFSALFGSRKEQLVDDKTIDSIFGKIRYIIYRLPSFLRPPITRESSTDGYMRIINPLNDNQLTGESANDNLGRGGRSSVCFLDEFAFVPRSESVWAAISDNSDCVIPLSTPNGKGNEFARLRHETKISVKSIHWSEHPLKTREWYDKRKADMLDWQVAQELDLSYERSQAGRVYTRFDRQWHVAKENIYFNELYEQFVCWDFGLADPTAIIWGQITTEGMIQIYQYYELSGQDIDFFIPISKGILPAGVVLLGSDEKKKLAKTLEKVPNTHIADHYGDHGGTQKTANSKRSCKAALREHGINLSTSGKQTFDWRIKCFDALLKLRYSKERDDWFSIFQISPDCGHVIDCLNNYRWASEDLNKEDIKPLHDWTSHVVSALEFFAINRFPIQSKTPTLSEYKVR